MPRFKHALMAGGALLAVACHDPSVEPPRVASAAPPTTVADDDPRDDPGQDEYRACEGKTCGDRCTVCDPADPDCVETAAVKACNPKGLCVPVEDAMCTAEAAHHFVEETS